MSIVIAICGVVAVYYYAKWTFGRNNAVNDFYTEFESETVSEQLAALNSLGEQLGAIEQLQIDLSAVDPRVEQKPITMTWLGSDGKNHSQTIFCDGSDFETETILDLTDVLIDDIKREISMRSAVLYHSTDFPQKNPYCVEKTMDKTIDGRGAHCSQ